MPQNGITTAAQQRSEAVELRGARKPPKRLPKPPTAKRAEDKRAAHWFDAGVAAYEKADAYAEAAQVDKAELSRMRSGDIAVALRRTIPMQDHPKSALAFVEAFLAEVEVAEHPDEVLALVAPLLDEIGYVARPVSAMTRAQMAEAVLCDLEGEPMGRRLIEQSAEKRGQGPQQLAMALRNEGGEK